MYNTFYKYLLLNYRAALPGIGFFSIEDTPAKMDYVTQTIIAPKQAFKFENDTAVKVDKTFYYYLSNKLKINEIEAIHQFNQFAQTIKEGALNGLAVLPGLGTLKRSYDEVIYFIPEHDDTTQVLLTNIQLQHSVVAEANLVDLYEQGSNRIIKQEDAPEEEKIITQEKEDYWWVYAIVLAILGFGALLYYYV